MCLGKKTNEKFTYQEELLEDIAPEDSPSMEQFAMLLNLLPSSTNMNEEDILLAAVNYILSLTRQLQEKLNHRRRSENSGL